MLFAYFLVIHHNLNSTFSPFDLFQRLRHHNASIYTTTESATSPFSDIYRSVVEIPQEMASTRSDIWTIPGSPEPQVYQLGLPIGPMMYQALGQAFEVEEAPANVARAHKASQCTYSKFDPDRLFQRRCEHTPDNVWYGQTVLSLPRVTLVERICAIAGRTSTSAVVHIGHPFTTRCKIHDLHEHPKAVLHITYRAKQHNINVYIHHRACYFNHVAIGMAGASDLGRSNHQRVVAAYSHKHSQSQEN